MNNKEESLAKENQDYEIDIKSLINIFKRNFRLISLITGILSVTSITYSYIVTPVYKGSFEIVVEKEKNNMEGKFLAALGRSQPIVKPNLKTQELILKSRSILMPVYDYVLENDPNINSEKLDYKIWLKKFLEITFKKGSNVLSINYKNTDEQLILNVLNKISDQYKSYSKSDRQRQVNNTLEFLNKQQKVYKTKSRIATKNFNNFSIENGLGDIDGFVELGNTSLSSDIKLNSEYEISKIGDLIEGKGLNFGDSKKNQAGQRFKNQFNMLEQYESEYTLLSSNLKPNSKTLKVLQSKIDNLKSSLKRPNEILLKFRELRDIASRNVQVLKSIEDKLVSIQLEKVKQLDPWKMISEPTLESSRISPNRTQIAIQSFVLGIIFGYFISIIKEYKSGRFYELYDIKRKLNCDYIETLNDDENNISLGLLKEIINSYNPLKIGIIDSQGINLNGENNNYKNSIFFLKEFNFISLLNDKDIKKFDKFIIFTQEGKTTRNQISILNKYINIYRDKFIGFIYVSKK